MTKELAIKILSTRDKYGVPCGWTSGYQEALDMAIEALKERPKGKWIDKNVTEDFHVTGQCSVCKERRRIDNFCPNCGADMRGGDYG